MRYSKLKYQNVTKKKKAKSTFSGKCRGSKMKLKMKKEIQT